MLLLIDADVTTHVAAVVAQEEVYWSEDTVSIYSDINKAKQKFRDQIKKYQEATQIDEFKLCFSGSQNFRKSLNPTYKGNRKGSKPVGYGVIKEWALQEFPSMYKPSLEADDCLGILATRFEGRTVILTIDKDLLSVPGKMYHLKPDGTGEWYDTDLKTADFRFLSQAISGDHTDGYGGVPGVGPKKAEELLKKHGAVWKTVEDAYIKAGLTKEDALLNARMARILRKEDWDFDNEQVKLWNP